LFTALDLLIVAAYLLLLAGVGVYFSRRQTSLDGFLVAGKRMTWLPVGMSLMAALNSGIDYLTQPSATIRFGLVLVVGTLSWLALYPWMSRIVFPFYHRLNFYSVYEYLEARFDVRVRLLAVLIFIVWRLGWMATALYVPCLAISAATGGAVNLTALIIGLGTLVTLYTVLGGIQAVIWNDVMQFCVMFGGLAATVIIVAAHVPGGTAEIWSAAAAAGKTGLWVPIGGLRELLINPVTVPSLLSALIVGRMAQYTSDQVMVQRLQTTRTVKDARQAFIVNAAGDALWMIGLSFVGLALFAYFRHDPAPPGLESDRMLPYFMARAFPTGAIGLVIAAILAASLSSIDSAIHSCSSVVVVDIYNRLIRHREVSQTAWLQPRHYVPAAPASCSGGASAPPAPAVSESRSGGALAPPLATSRSGGASAPPAPAVAESRSGGALAPPPVMSSSDLESQQIRVSRLITLAVGAAGTTLACNVAGIGSLLEIANKLINSFTGPLFGMFLLAMFSARAGSLAALAGGAAGAVASYYVAYHSGLSFLLPSTFGLVTTLAVGVLVTFAVPRSPLEGEALTWWVVMRRPLHVDT